MAPEKAQTKKESDQDVAPQGGKSPGVEEIVDHRKEEPCDLGRPRIGYDVLPGFLLSDGKKEESGDQEVTNPLKGPETQETRGRLGCI